MVSFLAPVAVIVLTVWTQTQVRRAMMNILASRVTMNMIQVQLKVEGLALMVFEVEEEENEACKAEPCAVVLEVVVHAVGGVHMGEKVVAEARLHIILHLLTIMGWTRRAWRIVLLS